MKQISILLLALMPFCGFSQKKAVIIKAISNKARIYEQDNPVSNWIINPKIKSDVFTTGKLTRSTTITIKTDIDSVSFRLNPGQKKELIIVLNGKDSCLTVIQSIKTKNFNKVVPEFHDSIPFFVNTYNTNFLPVIFNGIDSLVLNFDSGATEIDFTNLALKQKITSNPTLYTTNYAVKIGSKTYESKIYDIELAGNETDGLLGWDVFDGRIVELDYDKNKMIVHSRMPRQILRDRHYSKFKIKYIKNKPFIEGELLQSGIKTKNWFLFDLGYQRAVMLDSDLLKETKFPTEKMDVIKKVIMHGTRGNEIPVVTSKLEGLKLGDFKLTNVPAQVMGQNKPMRGATVHYLGNDVLKRFNTVLDFQKDRIYLKPNHLYDVDYADQKKKDI